MSDFGSSVSMWASIRTTRGIDRSISSSRAQSSGTSPNPSCRAAYAGNSETRSEVAVKITEMKSSTSRPLASMASSTISATRSSMWSRSSASSWVAPRTALTATGHKGSEQHRRVGEVSQPRGSARLVAPERPVVALRVGDGATAAAVVVVLELALDGRAGLDRALEDAVGVVGHEVRGGPADVVDRPVPPPGAEHDPSPARPQPLGVVHDRRVLLVAVGRVLGEADRGQPRDHPVGVREGHGVPEPGLSSGHVPHDAVGAVSWSRRNGNSSRSHVLGGHPARSDQSRARWPWSAYPQTAATSASGVRPSRARDAWNRATRWYSFGASPVSSRTRVLSRRRL